MTASVIHRQRVPPPCPCGHCSVASGFCPDHHARLGELRERYATDWKRKLASVANGGRAKPRAPACSRPGCWEPREMGAEFCSECQAEGYVDGIGE